MGEAQLQFGRRGGLSQAVQCLLAAPELHQACSQQLLLVSAERGCLRVAGLQQECFGAGPAGSPAGEMQGIAGLQRRREGRWVGRKALQQGAPQLGLLPAEGIEGIGAGGLLREAPQ